MGGGDFASMLWPMKLIESFKLLPGVSVSEVLVYAKTPKDSAHPGEATK